jgi:hypothetical protein
MKATQSFGMKAFLLAGLALLAAQVPVHADEGPCNSCSKRMEGGCASGNCSSGGCRTYFHTICGHKRSELPIIANPACYGYFHTQWQVYPCPNPTTEPEKEMPKVKEEAQNNLKPASLSKKTKGLKVQPAVLTLPSKSDS